MDEFLTGRKFVRYRVNVALVATVFVHEKNITSTTNNYSFSDGYTCQIFLMTRMCSKRYKRQKHMQFP